MRDFLLRQFLPFGLARTLSLAGMPLLQFLVASLCSNEEAGRFYLMSSLAFIASQIADLGISRAMPVLFSDDVARASPLLPEITILRLLSALLAGLVFLVVNHLGAVGWQWQTGGLLMFAFCVGRVILLGNQGYCHARQQYALLLRGSLLHVMAATVTLALAVYYQKLGAEAALAALTAGVWAELLVIDNSAAHPLRKSAFAWQSAGQLIWPFANVGLFTAINNRIESVVAGRFLDPVSLGIFGTLDSAFKMAIWPSYVSAQAVYPSVRDAIAERDPARLRRQATRHFVAGGLICAAVMVVSGAYWYFRMSSDLWLTVSASLLWFSLWISVPFAFLAPLYYSFRLETAFARLTALTTILRCALAVILAVKFGYVGLCANHAVISLLALAVFWKGLTRVMRQNVKSDPVARHE
ncbi:MAG TPA: hypothetical protein PKM56_04870 [Candidatus Rifleibacterium sp.]|nr:hypothetical protein [Candidatus Rifleibacterium sp.]